MIKWNRYISFRKNATNTNISNGVLDPSGTSKVTDDCFWAHSKMHSIDYKPQLNNHRKRKTKVNLFFLTAIGILVISNHNNFRVLFDKTAFVYFIWIYWYFSTGNGQPREPALCELYRQTFVPYVNCSKIFSQVKWQQFSVVCAQSTRSFRVS